MFRLAADARIPPWALEGAFFCVIRTSDELTIVCLEEVSSEDVGLAARSPDGVFCERGWVALQLQGPFPFSMTGVLASFLEPLASARVSIFAISTFDTDYVLIKREDLERAVRALEAAGHERVGAAGG